jgi:hypothetical protein
MAGASDNDSCLVIPGEMVGNVCGGSSAHDSGSARTSPLRRPNPHFARPGIKETVWRLQQALSTGLHEWKLWSGQAP